MKRVFNRKLFRSLGAVTLSLVFTLVFVFQAVPPVLAAQLRTYDNTAATADELVLGAPSTFGEAQPIAADYIYLQYQWKKFTIENPSIVTVEIAAGIKENTGTGWRENQLQIQLYQPNGSSTMANEAGSSTATSVISSAVEPTATVTYKLLPGTYFVRAGSTTANNGYGTVTVTAVPQTGLTPKGDSLLLAEEVELDTEYKGIIGYQGKLTGTSYGRDTINYYKFTIPENNFGLTLSVTRQDATQQFYMYAEIRNASNNRVGSSLDLQYNPSGTQDITVSTAGTYYLYLYNTSRGTEFTFTLSGQTHPEFNNTWNNAEAFNLNQQTVFGAPQPNAIYGHYLNYQWKYFEVSTISVLTVDVQIGQKENPDWRNNDLSITLYQPNGTSTMSPVGTSSSSISVRTGGTETASVQYKVIPGIYYVRASSGSQSTLNGYGTVTVTAEPVTGLSPKGDTLQTAAPAALNTLHQGAAGYFGKPGSGTSYGRDSSHWYSFTIPQNNYGISLTVSRTNETESISLYAYIRNVQNNYIGETLNLYTSPSGTMEYTFPTAGTYYLYISNSSSAAIEFTFRMDGVAPTTITMLPSANMAIGGTLQLTPNILPATPSRSVTWTTGNSSIATVSTNGLVTAHRAGSTFIRASVDGVSYASATCYITVTETHRPTLPTITLHPAGATTVNLKAATVLTTAANPSPGGTVSYQWFSNTRNSTTGGTRISNAVSARYTVPTTSAGTRFYYCVITNTLPGNVSAAATTRVASVTVRRAAAVAPKISKQPKGKTIKRRALHTLQVTARANPGVLSYQWFRSSKQKTGFKKISGAAGKSIRYRVPSSKRGTVYYRVVVTNTDANSTKRTTTTSKTVKVRVR
ncbi:MAG: Ig-like domain-containing protein [Oscillospiraceae bacterium]|nr:Ig-like domain-containing protein [Oscillospiraceae bacterium]